MVNHTNFDNYNNGGTNAGDVSLLLVLTCFFTYDKRLQFKLDYVTGCTIFVSCIVTMYHHIRLQYVYINKSINNIELKFTHRIYTHWDFLGFSFIFKAVVLAMITPSSTIISI